MQSQYQDFSTPLAVDDVPRGIVCRWDAPDGAQRVALSSSLVRELWQTAIQAFLALPRRGMEIGGLLFGQVRMEQSTVVFEISASEPVPCEHRFGPSYSLDDRDRKHLTEALERHRKDGSPPVIGFYRSYTGRPPHLNDADQELVREFFPNRHFVCLLLQPLSVEKCAATFEFFSGGEAVPAPVDEPFAFEAGRVNQPAPEPVRPPAAAAPLRPFPERSHPFPEIGRLPFDDPAPGIFGQSRMLVALVCILAVIVAIVSFQLWRVSGHPREASLHFDAKPSGSELMLRWDPASPAVLQATEGVLAITDGRQPTEIPLSQDQIRRGFFLYTPAGPNPLFQLRLYAQKNIVASDTLRVLQPSLALPAAAGSPAVSATDLPPLPPAPATPASAAVPAKVRREVQPSITQGIRRRISAPTTIPVVVDVDATGRVTHASSDIATHGLERYLADEAVKAARKWRFSPARSKEGLPVASTTTIPFAFAPAGRE